MNQRKLIVVQQIQLSVKTSSCRCRLVEQECEYVFVCLTAHRTDCVFFSAGLTQSQAVSRAILPSPTLAYEVKKLMYALFLSLFFLLSLSFHTFCFLSLFIFFFLLLYFIFSTHRQLQCKMTQPTFVEIEEKHCIILCALYSYKKNIYVSILKMCYIS